MDVKKTTTSTGFKLSVMTLAIMNVTAVVSLRGLPAEAVYGLSSAFYYLFAAIVFLIPTAMVAAELAAMFADKQGGVFRWVGEAYGARTGFLAIWLQWIESTIWYPTVLTFGAVSIAFIGMNDTHDALLASNKVFTLCMVLAIYWIATLIALKGLGWVGKISKWGGMIGTIIPAGLLIVLGIIYISTGGHNHMDMSQGFFPDLSKFNNLVLASSIFLFYAGMEMMGIHVMDVKNPSRNYPKAIIIGSLVTVLIFILGTFSLGLIIPAKDISLTRSLLVGFVSGGIDSWMSLIPIIMMATAFAYPLFGKKNYYCSNVCPCGSLQDLAGMAHRRKWHMSQKVARRLDYFRQGLFNVLVVLLVTGIWTEWMDYEVFSAFVFQTASAFVLVLGSVVGVLSLFVPRPYCRFVCPTGTLLRLAENRR